MEQSKIQIRYPEDFKPGGSDRIKNYEMVNEIYSHSVSPTTVSLVRNLETNRVLLLLTSVLRL